MIDEGVFKNRWLEMESLFRADLIQPVANTYYRLLSNRHDLTTDEFNYAVDRLMSEREFFPRVKHFVAKAREYRRKLEWERAEAALRETKREVRELTGRDPDSFTSTEWKRLKRLVERGTSIGPAARRQIASTAQSLEDMDGEEMAERARRGRLVKRIPEPDGDHDA